MCLHRRSPPGLPPERGSARAPTDSTRGR
jgi:hypothetical protein